MKEIYVSIDIEADGPIPGRNSMLSIGAAAFDLESDTKLVSMFGMNLQPLPEATQDESTMNWWRSKQAAWDAATRNARPAREVMIEFVVWVHSLEGTPVMVGYPSSYDFLFVYWYLIRFVEESPFSHSALDIKTLAMILLDTGYRSVNKKEINKRWKVEQRHSHIALDDAVEQGYQFVAMMTEINKMRARSSR